jgi:hypothetical protein
MSFAAPAYAASRPRGEALSYDLAPHGLALAIFALCAFSPAILNDGDTWSHIATGDWILAHRAVPHADPFSYSFAGRPWTAHEWLSEIALALAYRAAGYAGVVLLTAAAAAAAIFVVARGAARDLGGPALAALGGLALMLLAPSLLARPHILALPVFALWTQALFDARARDRAPPLGLALLMTLWANLHGGFAFGLALIAPLALEAVVVAEHKLAAARDWALFGLAAVTAALINPFGVEGLMFPVRLLGLKALAQVGEWGPESFAHPNALEAAMLGLIALALTRPFRLPPIRLALLLGLLHLSLSHARHEMLLAVVAPMLLARPLSEALAAPADKPRYAPRLALAGVVAAALVFGVGRLALQPPLPGGYASFRAALAALPAQTLGKPVLNGYAFGGYLIFEGVKPYVDGRADMFGDAFLSRYAHVARGEHDALTAVLARENVGWTLFSPEQGAATAMDAMPGWRRVYADPRVVAHVRIE